jgi:uncharacterized membrane protein
MAGGKGFEIIRACTEWAAVGIELIGVLVITAGVIRVALTRGTIRYLFRLGEPGAYESYKGQLGMAVLLGLDFLVAGDVVRTVALEPTPINVSGLGLLVVVRILLSWSLTVEIKRRWPWQAGPEIGLPRPAREAWPDGEPATGVVAVWPSTGRKMS